MPTDRHDLRHEAHMNALKQEHIEGAHTDEPEADCPYCGARTTLKNWLIFAEDVRPSDPAGHDWLEGLKHKTNKLLETQC